MLVEFVANFIIDFVKSRSVGLEVPQVGYEEKFVEIPEVVMVEAVKRAQAVDVPVSLRQEQALLVAVAELVSQASRVQYQQSLEQVPRVQTHAQLGQADIAAVPVEVPHVLAAETTPQVHVPVGEVMVQAVPRFQTQVIETRVGASTYGVPVADVVRGVVGPRVPG